MRWLLSILALAGIPGCADSTWQVRRGRPECQKICTHRQPSIATLLAVGNQAPRPDSATACICVPAPAMEGTLPDTPGAATAANETQRSSAERQREIDRMIRSHGAFR